MTSIADRVGAAPASWGICEVPGWGYQMPVAEVLAEMRVAGFTATELGPDDFFGGTPLEQAGLLRQNGLQAIGAFCPIVLHAPYEQIADQVEGILARFEVLDARMMVISSDTGEHGYDSRPVLDEAQWARLIANLVRIEDRAREVGVTACLHPHIGTQVQTPEEVDRVLTGCEVPLCLDSGHLTVGGVDPVELARAVPRRIAHVHIKDVRADVLAGLRDGSYAYTEAVRRGLYTVLGDGSVDIPRIIAPLEASGYRGWYIPELDRMLPDAAAAAGPLGDVQASVRFLAGAIGGGR